MSQGDWHKTVAERWSCGHRQGKMTKSWMATSQGRISGSPVGLTLTGTLLQGWSRGGSSTGGPTWGSSSHHCQHSHAGPTVGLRLGRDQMCGLPIIAFHSSAQGQYPCGSVECIMNTLSCTKGVWHRDTSWLASQCHAQL